MTKDPAEVVFRLCGFEFEPHPDGAKIRRGRETWYLDASEVGRISLLVAAAFRAGQESMRVEVAS